jgi:hypothetical protein
MGLSAGWNVSASVNGVVGVDENGVSSVAAKMGDAREMASKENSRIWKSINERTSLTVRVFPRDGITARGVISALRGQRPSGRGVALRISMVPYPL